MSTMVVFFELGFNPVSNRGAVKGELGVVWLWLDNRCDGAHYRRYRRPFFRSALASSIRSCASNSLPAILQQLLQGLQGEKQ